MWQKWHSFHFSLKVVLYHSVWFERDVWRIDFVVIFFQWTQNWTALNFEVNFQPLIQPYSSRLINNFCWGGWALLSVSKLERQRTSGTQKRSKSDFMYCRKVPFWPARNLIKEFRVTNITNHFDFEQQMSAALHWCKHCLQLCPVC